jgi:hypothetical protein
VEVGSTLNVETGLGIRDAFGEAGGFDVGSGAFEGTQAVIIARRIEYIVRTFVARPVFILRIIPSDLKVTG